MKLIASIMLSESSVDDYLQGLLETAYKSIAGKKGPAHDAFWDLSEDKQKNKLFVAMKRLDKREIIDYGVEVIEDMLEDFLASAHPNELHEDEAVQAVGKKLAAGKSGAKSEEPEVSEPVEPEEEIPAEETEEPEAEQPDEGTAEPTVDQRVIITKGVHKGEVHQFVGKTSSGLYKLKIVDIDADKIKYNGVGAAVKREDFKLVESLMSRVIRK
jgi:hypothetical protein